LFETRNRFGGRNCRNILRRASILCRIGNRTILLRDLLEDKSNVKTEAVGIVLNNNIFENYLFSEL